MNEVKLIKSDLIFPIIKGILANNSDVGITVTGTSMYPFLRENIDSVELSSTCIHNIKKGDIVMILRDSNEYVMHRVIKKENNHFYIIGDSQQWIEGPLYSKQLVAKITTVWRGNKKIKCNNIFWKTLSSIWLLLLPFRYFIIRIYSKLHRVTDFLRNLHF